MATKIATKRVSRIEALSAIPCLSLPGSAHVSSLIAPEGVSSDAEITAAVLRRAIRREEYPGLCVLLRSCPLASLCIRL